MKIQSWRQRDSKIESYKIDKQKELEIVSSKIDKQIKEQIELEIERFKDRQF